MAMEKAIRSKILIMALVALMLAMSCVQIWMNGWDWLNVALVIMSIILIIILVIDILRHETS